MSELNQENQELPLTDNRNAFANKIALILGVISLTFSLIAIAAFSAAESNNAALFDDFVDSVNSDSNGYDASWVPTGYEAWSEDTNIAWRWADSSDCDRYTCITAQFISRDGCSNGLYAAVNWLDANVNQNGSVFGFDNATLPSLGAMQVAKITFEDMSDTAKSAEISELNCR